MANALPRTLRLFNVFVEGVGYAGQAESVKLPKVAMKTEAYRAGGMIAEAKTFKGLEDLKLEVTYSDLIREIFASFGAAKIDAAQIRFVGSYAKEDSGNKQTVEISMRGRHNELEQDEAKGGEAGKFKVASDLTYYKQVVDGETWLEIDIINNVFVVMGVDRYAEHRAAVGL